MNKRKVLFLCIGNSCRSPMAEAFARKYGGDVLDAVSAGIAPAPIIQPLTYKVLHDKGIVTDGLFPKDVSEADDGTIDLVVNMSGVKISFEETVELRNWKIQDPIGLEEEVYVAVRDEIERQVMLLILELRRKSKNATGKEKRGASRKTGAALNLN